MKPPPYKCLFCLKTDKSFTRQEHPIPESMGNDNLVLPSGYVCDSCNQYFGSRLEQKVLNRAPFGFDRLIQVVKSKKGKLPLVKNTNLTLRSSGVWDELVFCSNPPHPNLIPLAGGILGLNPEWADSNDIVRFLLKVGLELLFFSYQSDPYSNKFDLARQCARDGRLADKWDFGLGIYPKRNDLIISERFDEMGSLETRQIYQYGMGIMNSGDIMFNLVYCTTMFAVNLSRPPSTEYILGFNKLNTFVIKSRWNLFMNSYSPFIYTTKACSLIQLHK